MYSPSDAVNTPPNRLAPRPPGGCMATADEEKDGGGDDGEETRRDEDGDDATLRLEVTPVVARRAARAVEGEAAAEARSRLRKVASSGISYT